MPPRFVYWTIIIDGTPTAFRAYKREELLPSLHQLQRTQPTATLKYFARGRLWESEAAARAALYADRPPERRGPEWRPGGAHQDPRDRFKRKKPAPGPARRPEGGDRPPPRGPWIEEREERGQRFRTGPARSSAPGSRPIRREGERNQGSPRPDRDRRPPWKSGARPERPRGAPTDRATGDRRPGGRPDDRGREDKRGPGFGDNRRPPYKPAGKGGTPRPRPKGSPGGKRGDRRRGPKR